MQLRNSSILSANSVLALADILLRIEHQTTYQIHYIGYGRKDWQNAIDTMQENVIYEMAIIANPTEMGHMLLLQKCGSFLTIYDPNIGTLVSHSTFEFLEQFLQLRRYDTRLNFLLMYQQQFFLKQLWKMAMWILPIFWKADMLSLI